MNFEAPPPLPGRWLARLTRVARAVGGILLSAGLAGCTITERPEPRTAAVRAEIAGKIAGIRDAILAKSAEGIVRPGTDDWSFTGPDGVTFDRKGFVGRTEALFARIVAIESLTTTVDRVELTSPTTADVEITQTMVRSERAADTGAVTRLWLHYRERHGWVLTPTGWRVRRVAFIGTPERRILATGETP